MSPMGQTKSPAKRATDAFISERITSRRWDDVKHSKAVSREKYYANEGATDGESGATLTQSW